MTAEKEQGQQNRIEEKASLTALNAAMLRFMGARETHPHFQGPDIYARLFLPPNYKVVLFFPFLRRMIRKRMTGGYEYIFARTQYFDELFKRALDENVPQIVLLGAGFDTRAIRFRESIQETRIFELDARFTQQQKKSVLQKAGLSGPHQVSFIPINFNKEHLDEVLSRAGFDPSQKTFFLWEGVTMYLSENAVRGTLGLIRSISGAGSTVAFDYLYKSAVEGTSDAYGAKETLAAVSEDREPWRFGIEDGGIETFIAELGFNILEHYTPEEFEKAYLQDEHGALLGRMYGFACHVHIQKQTREER